MRPSLPLAAKLGLDGLELVAAGELAPKALGDSARRDIRRLFASNQLAIAALTVPMRFGLDVAEQQEARIDYLREALTLSFDLGCRMVVIQPGTIPKDEKDARWPVFSEALLALGRHGDRIGAMLALETSADDPATVNALLAKLNTGGLAIAYNPGFLLVQGQDPYGAARLLHSRIAYVHATDARRGLSPKLVPVGRGDIDWLQMMGVLTEIDYRGWLTIDVDSANEAQASVAFLKRLLV